MTIGAITRQYLKERQSICLGERAGVPALSQGLPTIVDVPGINEGQPIRLQGLIPFVQVVFSSSALRDHPGFVFSHGGQYVNGELIDLW